jgi:hypothetical protein
MAFRATLNEAPGFGHKMTVKLIGRSGAVASVPMRAFEVKFRTVDRDSTVFGYGIASPGPLLIDSTGVIQGTPAAQANILSTFKGANPVTIGTGNATNPGGTAGTITTMSGFEPVLKSGVSVGGSTDLTVIKKDSIKKVGTAASPAPAMPLADTAELKPFAKNAYSSLNTTHENILIKANTNPTFSNGHTVRGLVYVEQPNVVKFNGNVTVQALIVTEDRGVGTVTGSNPTDYLYFAGNGGAKLPLEDLVKAEAGKFGFLEGYVGSFIVAPGFFVELTGNFGTIQGNVAGDRVTITGNSNSTVNGSIISLKPNQLLISGSTLIGMKPIAGNPHATLRFNHYYTPERDSYLEVAP